MSHAQYDILKHDAYRVWITDRNCGAMSVTNDAEQVVSDIARKYGDRRIIYRDSDGRWDELVHRGEQFIRFAPTTELP